MSPQPRAEPRWMSLADLMVAVAGCAVGYSLNPFSPGWVKPVAAYGAGSFQYDSIKLHRRGDDEVLRIRSRRLRNSASTGRIDSNRLRSSIS